jgi:aspartate racemase
MKTIGLLGGMSWESTLGYYRMINQGIKNHLGGLYSAQIAMVSVNFAPIEAAYSKGDWATITTILCDQARNIQAAGADFLLICTNTMHKLAPQISDAIDIPLLHIADATADELVAKKINCVGLIGTAATMEETFYTSRLTDRYHLDVRVPQPGDRQLIDQIIFNELCRGEIKNASKENYLRIIEDLANKGAQAIILGCTEISLLVRPTDTDVRLFDTTAIHAAKAVEAALQK